MKRASWITASFLALGVATPAVWAHGDEDHEQTGANVIIDRGNVIVDDVDDDDYEVKEVRSRTYVTTDREDDDFLYVTQVDRVSTLAHQLEQAASFVHRTAEQQAHYFDRTEEAAFQRLHRLDEMATRFHDYVESSRENPRRTERMFRNLLRAYGEAANAMQDLDDYRNVYAGFRDVQSTMNELSRYYGGYSNYGYNYSGSGYRYQSPDLRVSVGPISRDD